VDARTREQPRLKDKRREEATLADSKDPLLSKDEVEALGQEALMGFEALLQAKLPCGSARGALTAYSEAVALEEAIELHLLDNAEQLTGVDHYTLAVRGTEEGDSAVLSVSSLDALAGEVAMRGVVGEEALLELSEGTVEDDLLTLTASAVDRSGGRRRVTRRETELMAVAQRRPLPDPTRASSLARSYLNTKRYLRETGQE
jgi:hypothetical protein